MKDFLRRIFILNRILYLFRKRMNIISLEVNNAMNYWINFYYYAYIIQNTIKILEGSLDIWKDSPTISFSLIGFTIVSFNFCVLIFMTSIKYFFSLGELNSKGNAKMTSSQLKKISSKWCIPCTCKGFLFWDFFEQLTEN